MLNLLWKFVKWVIIVVVIARLIQYAIWFSVGFKKGLAAYERMKVVDDVN